METYGGWGVVTSIEDGSTAVQEGGDSDTDTRNKCLQQQFTYVNVSENNQLTIHSVCIPYFKLC
jgi:hypothetical protein